MSELKTGLESKGMFVDILGRTADGSGYTLYSQNKVISSTELLSYPKKQLNHLLDHLPNGHYELERYGLELAAMAFGISHYDVIHCQDVIASLALSRVKSPNTPLITSVHGSLPQSFIYLFKKNNPHITTEECKKTEMYHYNTALEYAGLHESQLVHTSSIFFRKQLNHLYGISNKKMVTIPYGLNVEFFPNQKAQPLEKNTRKKIITFTGRLSPIKGLTHLIHALHELKKVRKDWLCWIIGDGELKEDLISQAQQLNLLEDIKFFGKRNDVFSKLKSSDIFVLPSLQDNQPYSVMEAQFAGLPSVVTRTGGLPEMVKHGETGLVVPPANHHALFLSLQQLLENDTLRYALGKEARRSAEKKWCFQNMLHKFIQMYKALI